MVPVFQRVVKLLFLKPSLADNILVNLHIRGWTVQITMLDRYTAFSRTIQIQFTILDEWLKFARQQQ